jgi:hypothetical protein
MVNIKVQERAQKWVEKNNLVIGFDVLKFYGMSESEFRKNFRELENTTNGISNENILVLINAIQEFIDKIPKEGDLPIKLKLFKTISYLTVPGFLGSALYILYGLISKDIETAKDGLLTMLGSAATSTLLTKVYDTGVEKNTIGEIKCRREDLIEFLEKLKNKIKHETKR